MSCASWQKVRMTFALSEIIILTINSNSKVMVENTELNAVALRLSKAFCNTKIFECGEIEILCSLLDEFSLASKGCEYNYFECEIQNDLYLSLEWEFNKIWFNFYDVNASQSVFCFGEEVENSWNGASEIICELQKLI